MAYVTWDGVLKIINASGKSGITNQQINAALGECPTRAEFFKREIDVQYMTSIMAKAGAINVAKLIRASIGHLYYPNGNGKK